MLAELVPLLRRYGELDLDDATAALLVGMSAATIDRKLAPARAKMLPRGRSHTKPGSILKSKIAMRTWADHDEDAPGFVEVDLVAHEGGNAAGRFCFTLTVTDIATGWTENRPCPTSGRSTSWPRSPRWSTVCRSRSEGSTATTAASSSTTSCTGTAASTS